MAQQQAATSTLEPTHGFFEHRGLKIHYLDWGGDPAKLTFVLLHGGAAHAHWWDQVAPELVPYGRVIALDFRGHGRSDWANPPIYGPPAYVDDVRGLLEHLGGSVVLVGHSMGGVIAQWCAVLFPEKIETLVLVDSPHGPPSLWRRLQWQWRRRAHSRNRPELKSADDIKRKFRLLPLETYLTKEQLAELALKSADRLPNGNWVFRFDPQTRAWRRLGIRVARPNLRNIIMPTLILRGSQSGLLSDRNARKMTSKIKGSTYREIDHAYHHVPLDNPHTTAAAIIEFVNNPR